jgi:hypothetical protein
MQLPTLLRLSFFVGGVLSLPSQGADKRDVIAIQNSLVSVQQSTLVLDSAFRVSPTLPHTQTRESPPS